ncbi:MAG: RNA-binding cell elongation regulator Jag/EloR [Clostridia bacterium]|nr:RNA-binding cell elongation regulator Jag/EloR [Clostridia bacterium]
MNSVIAEGKTTAEAIENGLKQLNVSKDKVNIKVLENAEKRSFFSILAPRVVKVELTLKDVKEHYAPMQEHVNQITPEQIEIAKKNLTVFLDEFSTKFEDFDYDIKVNGNDINVELKGNDSSKLIGYRGETLNSIQIVMSTIANKNVMGKVRIILDIAGYREKRKKILEDLADKISKTVIKTGKTIMLEPMPAYERKIIHTRLQNNEKVKTFSKGEEPYRKIVISKNK